MLSETSSMYLSKLRRRNDYELTRQAIAETQ
jgi:hypothetical protein